MIKYKVEEVNIEKLKPIKKNVRLHNATQLRELLRSFKMFDQYKPIVIDEDNNILAGNAIYQALKEAGEKTILAHRKLGLSKSDKKKLLIADNRTYELGVTNNDNILEILGELKEKGELDIPGYDSKLLDIIVKNDALAEIKDYGAISQETIKEIEETKFRMKEQTPAKKDVILTNENIKMGDREGVPTPFILCKCGERIWL